MDREQFIAKHGKIQIAKAADRYFARLRRPQLVDGVWTVTQDQGPKILAGRFYTIGYVRADLNPLEQQHNWAALDHARHLTTKWVRKLKAGNCYALHSDGDGPYFPFICATAGQLDAEVLGATVADDLRPPNAESSSTTADLSGQSCLFWADDQDADYAENLPEQTYDHYREVSAWMRAAITNPVEVRLYSDAIEFPVIYGGTSQDGLFIGLITSWVWT